MKRFLLVFFALAAVAVSAFGVGGAETTSPDKGGALSFSVYQPTFGGDTIGTAAQDLWLQQAEQYAGVKLDITWRQYPWGEYTEKMGPYLASQAFDDMFLVTSGKNVINNLGDSGLIVNLLNYPDSIKSWTKFLEGGMYNRVKVSTPEGKIYGFYDSAWTTRNLGGALLYYRFDIFKKHNLKYPQTMDEYYQTAKKLKSLYPDSYPIGSQEVLGGSFINRYLQYNHTNRSIYWDGKQFKFGPVDDAERFKAVLTYFRKMYAEGLLDPEAFTLTLEQFIERCLNGKYLTLLGIYDPWLDEKLTNTNFPDVEWGITRGTPNFFGEVARTGGHRPQYLVNDWAATVISTKAKNPELIAKVMDYTYTQEAVTTARFGIPNVTYQIGNDGLPMIMPEFAKLTMNDRNEWLKQRGFVDRVGIQFQMWWYHWAYEFYEVPLNYYIDGKYIRDKGPNVALMKSEAEDKLIWDPNGDRPPIQLSQDERDMQSSNMNPINTYVNESLAKFIIGDMSINEYDAFIAQIKKFGDYAKVLAMMNQKAAAFK